MKTTIYGLVDPTTNQFRYVGRTNKTPAERLREHLGAAQRGKSLHPVYAWIRSLRPAQPIVVILQEGIQVQRTSKLGHAGTWDTAEAAETKWKKRLERSSLLCEIPRGTAGRTRRS